MEVLVEEVQAELVPAVIDGVPAWASGIHGKKLFEQPTSYIARYFHTLSSLTSLHI